MCDAIKSASHIYFRFDPKLNLMKKVTAVARRALDAFKRLKKGILSLYITNLKIPSLKKNAFLLILKLLFGNERIN